MFFNKGLFGQILVLFVQIELEIPVLFLRHKNNKFNKKNEGKKCFCISFMLCIFAVQLPTEYKTAAGG